jgi:hypothetical protein
VHVFPERSVAVHCTAFPGSPAPPNAVGVLKLYASFSTISRNVIPPASAVDEPHEVPVLLTYARVVWTFFAASANSPFRSGLYVTNAFEFTPDENCHALVFIPVHFGGLTDESKPSTPAESSYAAALTEIGFVAVYTVPVSPVSAGYFAITLICCVAPKLAEIVAVTRLDEAVHIPCTSAPPALRYNAGVPDPTFAASSSVTITSVGELAVNVSGDTVETVNVGAVKSAVLQLGVYVFVAPFGAFSASDAKSAAEPLESCVNVNVTVVAPALTAFAVTLVALVMVIVISACAIAGSAALNVTVAV